MRLFRKILLLLFPVLLLCACNKDQPFVMEPEDTELVPFSVTVQPEADSRASFDGAAFGSGNYVFAEGDKLYITGGGGNISGELTLVSGAGIGTATFNGTLTVSGGYQPTAETELNATLVGTQQNSSFFTISDGRIATGPNYPASIACTTLTDLVQKYSHFTATFNYGVRSFTLTQQTVFLDFSVELFSSALTGSPATVQMDIKSSGGSTLLSVTDVPVGGNSTIAKMAFIAIFPASTNLQGAQTWVNNGSGIHCEPDFANDLTLSPNKYYGVSRSLIDPFTVEAPSSGTGATVTFHYTPVQYRTYSGGTWSDWADYSSPVPLSAGEKVSFRGQRTSYANSSGNTPLIESDNNVIIYGDIMSLVCDENWNKSLAVGAGAFEQAFKGCTNINISAEKELYLTAMTLADSCYVSMFSGCTGLTKTPILPARNLTEKCYAKMFTGCTGLTGLPSDLLPATTMASTCYMQMFDACTGLTSLPTGLLPAETLALACYKCMFRGCSNLASTPTNLLPATSLAKGCYNAMFYECTKLVRGPDLMATTPVPGCYFCMFRKCTKLNFVKCNLTLTEFGVDKPSGHTDTNNNYYPRVSDLNSWSACDFWTVYNKWLTEACTAGGGSFYCPEGMKSKFPTGDASVGAVPTSKWTKYNIADAP